MERVRLRLICMIAVAVLATGCGGDDPADDGLRGAKALEAPAVMLRAELAAALGARAWLTALAVRTTLIDGAAAPTALGAQRTLDMGSEALASRLTDAFGEQTGARALTLLRRQDTLWTEGAKARAADDAAAAAATDDALDANRTALAQLLATGGLTSRELESEFEPAYASLAAAVDAVVAGDASAPARTALAAARATRPAPELIRAAARRRPQLVGGAASPAAELAAVAAAAFTDSAFAQATTSAVVVAGAKRGPRLRAATRTLQETTDTLGQLVASVYGEDAGERFAALWSAHASAFTDYARAKANADVIVAQRALAALERFRAQTASLLAQLDADGPRSGLAKALTAHVDTTTAAIRAQATRSAKFGPRLLAAADATRAVGEALAARFARQFPETFTASR
jgi:hypothetical protein